MPGSLRVLAIVLAGGKGERLQPLTRDRSKPAVPFGGRYRLIDFVLSSFVNSGILSVYVLVQYKAQSLIEHLRSAWRTGGLVDHFITVVPPQMRLGPTWYQGSADAVLQNLNLVDDHDPHLVAVFGADHVYRMDVQQMVAFHLERDAEVTVAARPLPVAEAREFGVLAVDASGRVVDFVEKPASPRAMPGNPALAYVSMGNYLFTRRALVDALVTDARRPDSVHDFGKSIIPDLFPRARVFAYDFLKNQVPAIKPYEEPGYWRDVGTLDAYFRAHMDLLGETPPFDLDNRRWPVLTGRYHGPPVRVVSGEIENSQMAEGCLVRRAVIRNSILGRGVWVNEGALIEDSIIMDFTTVGKGVHLRRAIVDRFNIVGAGQEIGLDPDADRARYHVDETGLVAIPRGGRREYFQDVE